MSNKLPDQYQERLTKVIANMIPQLRKALDIAGEFGVEQINAPFVMGGYEKEFEVIIRPVSKIPPPPKQWPPSLREIRTKAKALYVAWCIGSGETKEEAESIWGKLEKNALHPNEYLSPEAAYSFKSSYLGWITAAKEALS